MTARKPRTPSVGDSPAVTTEQVADNTSTGAVDYQSPATTTVDHLGSAIVPAVPTPGPVTMGVTWPSELKVIRAPEAVQPTASDVAVEVKAAADDADVPAPAGEAEAPAAAPDSAPVTEETKAD